MKDDSVRIEVQNSIVSSGRLPRIEQNATALPKPQPMVQRTNPYSVPPPAIRSVPTPVVRENVTGEFTTAKTSPTLVEFQAKPTSVPDWKLQVQNAVRQRTGSSVTSSGAAIAVAPARVPRTRVEPVAVASILENADSRLGNALKRIENSQNIFGKPEPTKPAFAPRVPTAKSFPFDVVAPSQISAPVLYDRVATVNPTPKPVLVSAPFAEKRDTNKLPKLSEVEAKPIQRVEDLASVHETKQPEFESIKRIFISADATETELTEEVETDEIEDLAPFSMRFNAALFDLIIGVVGSMILLSPLMLTGAEWASVSGGLIFAGTCAIVLFAYLTASIGFYGKTYGMRLFSLEIVDAEENVYPTMNQAAVNSAIYLVSMAFGGVGFVTMFFNEEKRAAQDLMSGTIIVREFN